MESSHELKEKNEKVNTILNLLVLDCSLPHSFPSEKGVSLTWAETLLKADQLECLQKSHSAPNTHLK